MDNLVATDKLAAAVHREQVDKSGNPYVQHVRAVASNTKGLGGSEHQQLAGLLHDSVEDTSCTPEQLRELGVPEPVVELVGALTDGPGESQDDYLARLIRTPDAVLVKRADIAHNSSPERLQLLDPATRDRLRLKYSRALETLSQV